jgi:hypothetical protein
MNTRTNCGKQPKEDFSFCEVFGMLTNNDTDFFSLHDYIPTRGLDENRVSIFVKKSGNGKLNWWT